MTPSSGSARRDLWIAAALVVAFGALFLVHLDRPLLWQDEAQTALLGKSVVERSLPYGFDGRNYFSQELGAEYGPRYLWRWHTWLSFYVEAASFEVFGVTTRAARLPFALFGLATVPLLYAFGLRLWRDRRAALIGAALLGSCVPFLLLSRQCRYYAPAAFFMVLGLHAYQGILDRRRRSTALLVVAATLEFHTLYLYCATLLATVLCHALWRRRDVLRRVLIACAVATAIEIPWLLWLAKMRYGERYGEGLFSVARFVVNLGGLLEQAARYVFPPGFLLLLLLGGFGLVAARRSDGAQPPTERPTRDAHALVWIFVVINLLALALTSPAAFLRYLAPVLPALCLAIAPLIAALVRRHWSLGALLCLALFPHGWLLDFFYELRHDYHGPIEGIVEHLNREGHPGQTVAISYEDLPLKFYTDMRVIGGLTGEDLSAARTADWVILRATPVCDKDRAVADYLRANIQWANYRRVEIDAPDSKYENRECVPEHAFRSPSGVPKVVVFQRVR